jgi:hypothetical protein
MGLFESRFRKKDAPQPMMGVGMGMEVTSAARIAQPASAYIPKVPDSGQLAILPALLGGGLAAVLGGGIWGFIVILTGYVIGYMAWGIGLLSGYAVVLFSRGAKGMPLQVIAVLSSVLGIAIGKYATFFHFAKKAVAKQHGEAVAANVSFLSERLLQVFVHNIGSMLSGFDILWVFLAVITAWRIPKAIGAKQQG